MYLISPQPDYFDKFYSNIESLLSQKVFLGSEYVGKTSLVIIFVQILSEILIYYYLLNEVFYLKK